MPHTPDLRKAANDQFDRAWDEAILAGQELRLAFERLAKGIAGLAEFGSRQTLTFQDELVQQFWVRFQEEAGQFVPRDPIMPPMMEIES